jgi:hypothetical protein
MEMWKIAIHKNDQILQIYKIPLYREFSNLLKQPNYCNFADTARLANIGRFCKQLPLEVQYREQLDS